MQKMRILLNVKMMKAIILQKNQESLNLKGRKSIIKLLLGSKRFFYKILINFNRSTLHIKNSLIKLHNEIIDFYEYIKPSKRRNELRENSIKHLKNLIQEYLP